MQSRGILRKILPTHTILPNYSNYKQTSETKLSVQKIGSQNSAASLMVFVIFSCHCYILFWNIISLNDLL